MALEEIDSNEESNVGGRQLLMLLLHDTNPLQRRRLPKSMNSIKQKPAKRYVILRPTNPLSSRAEKVKTAIEIGLLPNFIHWSHSRNEMSISADCAIKV